MKLYSIKTVVLVFMLAAFTQEANAQVKKFTFNKVSRDTKKEARKYEKDGYKTFPGAMPIAQQLNGSYSKQNEVDQDGYPRWIIASGSSVGETQAAAENAAVQIALVNLAKLIESNIRSVIETDLANNQINNEEATSITKVVSVSVDKVAKKLGMVTPIFKVYRSIDKNTEVQVMIGYNYELVKKQLMDEMRAELQQEAVDIRAKNEQWLNQDPMSRGAIRNYAGDEPAKP